MLFAKSRLITITIFILWAALSPPPTFPQRVLTGADVLVRHDFRELAGRRIGLITNHSAVLNDGRHLLEALRQSESVKLVALFAPEHGLRGRFEAGRAVADTAAANEIPIFSLYGRTKKPTPEMLKDIDLLLFDIQDVGARFYTYISTMALALEAAAENGIAFVVADRPNPISGAIVEGPVLEPELESFVGIAPIALRHGMTVGELAQMFTGENWIALGDHVELHIVKMENWQRRQFFDATGLPWVKPSPNIVSLQGALLYPGLALLEATNVSEGRGTLQPFIDIGAPWIDAGRLAEKLESLKPAGVAFSTVSFTPQSLPGMAVHPKYLGETCHGIRFEVTNPAEFHSVELGIGLLCALRDLYPNHFKIDRPRMNRLLGSSRSTDMLTRGRAADEIIQSWQPELERFRALRKKYLIYPEL